MKKMIVLAFGIYASNLFAAGTPVPYVFTAGDSIRASEINANFQELANRAATQETSSGKLYIFSTPASYAADTGRKAFGGHCEGVDANARMCTVALVRNAQNAPGITYDSQFQGGWIDNWTGLDSTGDNCNGWSMVLAISSSYLGAHMTNTGRLNKANCDASYPVVCCK